MEEKNIVEITITKQELEVKYIHNGIDYTKTKMKHAVIRVMDNFITDTIYANNRDKYDLALYTLNNLETYSCDELATLLNKYGQYAFRKVAVIPMEGE